MAEPVRETVYFTVTVRTVHRGDHWKATALETGVITAGKTREEAERRIGVGHVLLVQSVKRRGREALDEFMSSRGIGYTIGEPPGERPRPAFTNESVEEVPVAA